MTSPLLGRFLVSFNLQSAICGLQSAVCSLRSAVCSLQSANVIHQYKQIIAWFVCDIRHKCLLWYFKIVSNFTCLTACEFRYNNFEISLVVFMPNITTNHAITDTNSQSKKGALWLRNLPVSTLYQYFSPILGTSYKFGVQLSSRSTDTLVLWS